MTWKIHFLYTARVFALLKSFALLGQALGKNVTMYVVAILHPLDRCHRSWKTHHLPKRPTAVSLSAQRHTLVADSRFFTWPITARGGAGGTACVLLAFRCSGIRRTVCDAARRAAP